MPWGTMDSTGAGVEGTEWPKWVDIGVPILCVVIFAIVLFILAATYKSPTEETELLMKEMPPSTSDTQPKQASQSQQQVSNYSLT